jgi:hypothetical protein
MRAAAKFILPLSPFMDSTILVAPAHVSTAAPASAACANCDAPRMGEYCHRCGQHFLEGRLTVRRLVMDFVVRKLGLEGGLLRTMVDLTVRPAAMIRAYVDGRRQRYTNPVAYLLLSASAYLLFSRAWADEMAAGMRAENSELYRTEAEAMVQVQSYMDAHPALMTMVLCLFLVPGLRLLFRRTTTIAEASVFSLYVSAHLLLLQMAIYVGALLLSADVYDTMTGWPTLLPMLVLLFAAGRFFGTRLSSYVRMAVALCFSLTGLVTVLIIAAGILVALAAPAAQ